MLFKDGWAESFQSEPYYLTYFSLPPPPSLHLPLSSHLPLHHQKSEHEEQT